MGDGLPDRVYIDEKATRTFTDCPPEIGKQLQRAAFTESEKRADTYIKSRTPHGSDNSRPVVTATVENGELTVSAREIVGIVELTPRTKLQINPNIDWEDILEMFLAVRQQQRSLEYQGIPIDDFLADDIQIQDIFIVITVNYLSALQPLHRNGFIRQFETQQYNSVTGRGQIDVEQSIMNHRRGIPKQRYIKKNIDYNTPVNTLIYLAGKQLLRLFQTATATYHDQYFRIFSELREALKQMERVGIEPERLELSEARSIKVSRLPRQRNYYRDAVQVSKMVLSSATGESLATGNDELTMDFILDMVSLFEQYTQIVLEEELDFLQNSPIYSTPGQYQIKEKPTLPVFENEQGHYQPDHVLWNNNTEDAVAVLDSKYYSKSRTPMSDTDARNRMLAYAHLLEVDEMTYLSPFGPTARRELALCDGTLRVISPVGSDFSSDGYHDAIREYLKQKLDITTAGGNIPTLQTIAYPDVTIDSFEQLAEADALKIPDDDVTSYLRAVSESAIKHSNQVGRKTKSTYFEVYTPLRDYVENEVERDNIMLLPLLITSDIEHTVPSEDTGEDWDGEALAVYPITTEEGYIKNVGEPKYIRLEWD